MCSVFVQHEKKYIIHVKDTEPHGQQGVVLYNSIPASLYCSVDFQHVANTQVCRLRRICYKCINRMRKRCWICRCRDLLVVRFTFDSLCIIKVCKQFSFQVIYHAVSYIWSLVMCWLRRIVNKSWCFEKKRTLWVHVCLPHLGCDTSLRMFGLWYERKWETDAPTLLLHSDWQAAVREFKLLGFHLSLLSSLCFKTKRVKDQNIAP